MGEAEPADKWDSGASMVRLTRLNHAPIVLNSDLIEHIDITPDTVISMTTGQVFRVLETAEEVVSRIVEFRRRTHQPPSPSEPIAEPPHHAQPPAPAQ
jgi:flagellar protein FlbD